ncbi:MAG: hypothetical protein OQL19_18535 [Gammaproteobacteria bacterium]|nr:hypothetical protein [Gammaproteobacteria bacterium]
MKKFNYSSLDKITSMRLLGDIVCSMNDGVDMDIMFSFNENKPKSISANGKEYSYKRSTIASLNGIIIGKASTYWYGPKNIWKTIENRRMLTVIKESGRYSIRNMDRNKIKSMMNRAIRVHIGNNEILIREKIYLSNLISATNKQPTICLAESI